MRLRDVYMIYIVVCLACRPFRKCQRHTVPHSHRHCRVERTLAHQSTRFSEQLAQVFVLILKDAAQVKRRCTIRFCRGGWFCQWRISWLRHTVPQLAIATSVTSCDITAVLGLGCAGQARPPSSRRCEGCPTYVSS